MSEQSIFAGNSLHTSLGQDAVRNCGHAVQFYEDESSFLDSLGEFAGGALGAGGACVVVATAEHRAGLEARLASFGIDMAYISSAGRYIALDAAETMALFMDSGQPVEERFYRAIEPVLVKAGSAFRARGTPVVAFGEMVALLYREGRIDAAIRVEQLWNELARLHSFSLRCAYPLRVFADESHSRIFRRICEEHDHVIPAESYTAVDNRFDRWRVVSNLQQQAYSLQAALELRQREFEQRVKAEQRLHRAEEFARAVADFGVDCVQVLSLDGRVQYINGPGCRALELDSPGEGLGCDWLEMWPVDDRPRATSALAAAAAGQVGSFQGECTARSGARKAWDVRITAGRDASGEIEQLIAVSRDITDLRMAQTAAIRAEKLATAGRMAATIAHEINNPLEAVTNFIYLAQSNEDLPEEVRAQLEIADRELTRVAHIARQTLGFYRSTSVSRWIPAAELIRDSLQVYERRMRNKDLQVEVSVDPALRVYARDGEIRQALLNLTANAIDACHSGGRIWLRAQRTRNWTNGMEDGVRFTLADNGGGMSAETQGRLFVPFFTTKPEVGTGIGLWVTKCLIEQRGGYLRFRSRQGQRSGTVMSFFLPSGQPAELMAQAAA